MRRCPIGQTPSRRVARSLFAFARDSLNLARVGLLKMYIRINAFEFRQLAVEILHIFFVTNINAMNLKY